MYGLAYSVHNVKFIIMIKEGREIMKKGIIIGIIILFILLIIGLPLYIVLMNNEIANRTTEELANIQLPENTQVVDTISIAGKVSGNGNGMQYFGAVLLKTNLSEEELDTYYQQYRGNSSKFLIKKQETEKIEVIDKPGYYFQTFNEEDKEKYYILYSYGSADGIFLEDLLELDLRGH